MPDELHLVGAYSLRAPLKPDVTAPGAQVLSSTLPEFAGDQFAVLDGTSFSAPHISGVAALLTQRHPSWTPQQMKSALMSTAGPAWGDTSLTQEASVLVEGAGLVNVGSADKPLVFSDPQSLSFGYLVAGRRANSRSISVAVSDAGDGAGTWVAEVQPTGGVRRGDRLGGAGHARPGRDGCHADHGTGGRRGGSG